MTAWDTMADSALPIVQNLIDKMTELVDGYTAEPPTITAQQFVEGAKDWWKGYVSECLQKLLMVDSTGQTQSWFDKFKDLLSTWV